MHTGRLNFAIAILSICCASTYGCGEDAVTVQSTPLAATQHVHIVGEWAFTISPDDRWLLFHQRPEGASSYEAHSRLHMLTLADNELHQFRLPEELAKRLAGILPAQWSEDGRYYATGIYAVLTCGDDGPRLITSPRWQRKNRMNVAEENIVLEMAAHCSDCHEYEQSDEQLRVLEAAFREGEREGGEAYVAQDGKWVFHQRGAHSGRVRIYVRNVENKTDRLLATHRGRCVRANRIRASPDGRYLAYQLGIGCGFTRPAQLYIVDVETRDRWRVEPQLFARMHWTSDSSRLYFVKREGWHDATYIHYVDLPPAAKEAKDKDDESREDGGE